MALLPVCVTNLAALLLHAGHGLGSHVQSVSSRTRFPGHVIMLSIAQAAAGVAPAYDLDDLDDEWKALLNELEDRLYQVHSVFSGVANTLPCRISWYIC